MYNKENKFENSCYDGTEKEEVVEDPNVCDWQFYLKSN